MREEGRGLGSKEEERGRGRMLKNLESYTIC